MKRSWIQVFYTECGREVSLAYNVLNETNTWGVTLAVGLLAAGAVNAVEVADGQIHVLYPTVVHWFFVIVAWIVMVRFFVRSCLALANMYRWNALIDAASKILALPEGDPNLAVFERNFYAKLRAYFYDWRCPVPRSKIIWYSLKLMYLWFFLLLLALILWGAMVLEKDWLYWGALSLLVVPTALEVLWFWRWYGFKHGHVELEEEPDIVVLLTTSGQEAVGANER